MTWSEADSVILELLSRDLTRDLEYFISMLMIELSNLYTWTLGRLQDQDSIHRNLSFTLFVPLRLPIWSSEVPTHPLDPYIWKYSFLKVGYRYKVWRMPNVLNFHECLTRRLSKWRAQKRLLPRGTTIVGIENRLQWLCGALYCINLCFDAK